MVMQFYGKKRDTSDIYSQQPDHGFCPGFLYNRIWFTSWKTKSRDENKVAATEQGNFYWERRLYSFLEF